MDFSAIKERYTQLARIGEVGYPPPKLNHPVEVDLDDEGVMALRQRGNPVRVAIEIVRHGQRVAISNWMNLLPGGGVDCVLELERPILHAADLIVMSAVDGAQDFSWVFADKLCIEVESFEAE